MQYENELTKLKHMNKCSLVTGVVTPIITDDINFIIIIYHIILK